MANTSATAKSGATTCDGFLDGRFKAFQPRKGPRAAIDALFLAAAVPAQSGTAARILDAGTGAGVAGLAMASRVPDASVTGVEVQPALCDLARRNAALNGLEGRYTVMEADVTASPAQLREWGLERESFDHTVANPPFLRASEARVSPDPATATAYAAQSDALEKWIGFLGLMTARRGSVTMIHRADALDRVLDCLRIEFGRLTVFPLFPREGKAAGRVIVQGIKGSRGSLTLARGLILHEADGRFTKQADAVLRQAAGLTIHA